MLGFCGFRAAAFTDGVFLRAQGLQQCQHRGAVGAGLHGARVEF